MFKLFLKSSIDLNLVGDISTAGEKKLNKGTDIIISTTVTLESENSGIGLKL